MGTAIQPEIGTKERDRVLAHAEGNPAFWAVGYALSELVDSQGVLEREIEAALGQERDLVVLFRLLRNAAAVNRRLGDRRPEERLTEAEWRARDAQRTRAQMMEHMKSMMDQQDRQRAQMLQAAPALPGGEWMEALRNIGK